VPSEAFIDALNDQIGNEFAASQQYVACAVYYDSETLPRLASFFYQQAVEERNHAMMMAQYVLDSGGRPVVPAIEPPQGDFGDIIEPVQLAHDQEKRVTEQINQLAGLAREQGDYPSEQFLQWFLKEQVEEVSSMHDLLTIVRRANGDALRAEEWLARESAGSTDDADPTAPPAAGGRL
jgi:ferritin